MNAPDHGCRDLSVHRVPCTGFSLGFNLLTLSLLFDSFLAPWRIGMVCIEMDNSGGFMADNTEKDDGIIELTQVVEADLSDAIDPDVIELTDISTQMEGTEQEDLALDFDLEMDEAIEPVAEPIVPVATVSEAPATAIDAGITQEQIDEALERVIEKKFAETIEKSLLEVMEKVLEREIADIRKRLQKDLDEIVSS
jgi:hypothetical protein